MDGNSDACNTLPYDLINNLCFKMKNRNAKKPPLKDLHFGRCHSDLIILDLDKDQYYCVPDFFGAVEQTYAGIVEDLSLFADIDEEAHLSADIFDRLKQLESPNLGEIFTPRWLVRTYIVPKSRFLQFLSIAIVLLSSLLIRTLGFYGARIGIKAARRLSIFRHVFHSYTPEDLINMIDWAYRFDLSGNQCLSNSFAIQIAFLLSGRPASLIIGARTRPFRSHAWVVYAGKVINDDENIATSLVFMAELK